MLQQLARFRVLYCLEQRRVEQPDGLHRLAQVVTGGREEPALGTVRAFGLLAGNNELFVDEASLGPVANRRRDELFAADVERCEADTGREFGAVGAQREQVGNACSHLAVVRLAHEAGDVLAVPASQALRHQHVDGLAHERLRRMAEHLGDRLVREADAPAIVDHDQGIRREPQQVLGDFAELVHRQSGLRGIPQYARTRRR